MCVVLEEFGLQGILLGRCRIIFDFTVFADYDIRQKQIDVLKDEVNNFQERDAQRRKEIDIATKDWKNVSVGI